MNVRIIILSILLLFTVNGLFSKSNTKQAKLAILEFLDNTASKNYAYIKNSLTEPIVSKMSENFLFERPNVKTIQEYGDRFLGKKKYFKDKDLKAFCKFASVDYIIFGFYKKVKRKNKLSIYTGIYSDSSGKIIARLSKTVPTTSNMFTKIDELAEEFVFKIREYVHKQKKQGVKEKRQLIVKEKKIIVKKKEQNKMQNKK